MDITVEKLNEMRENGEAHTLLDVREDNELSIANIDGVLHIPMNSVPLRIDELPSDRPLIVMCHSGMRSAQVQAWLAENVFENTLNLAGGIDAWSERIDQSVPKY